MINDDDDDDDFEENLEEPAPLSFRPPIENEGMEAFREFMAQRLEGMHEAAKQINQMTVDRIRRVPEPHFRAVLLPVVRSWVTKDSSNLDPRYWFNVADGLNNPIHVVDAEDKILFTVPPPFLDIPMPTTYDPGKRMSTVYQEAALQGIHADNGNQKEFWAMEKQMAEKYTPVAEEEDRARALTQLVEMYRYYSLPIAELLGEEGAKQVAPILSEGGKTPPEQKDEKYDDDESWSY